MALAPPFWLASLGVVLGFEAARPFHASRSRELARAILFYVMLALPAALVFYFFLYTVVLGVGLPLPAGALPFVYLQLHLVAFFGWLVAGEEILRRQGSPKEATAYRVGVFLLLLPLMYGMTTEAVPDAVPLVLGVLALGAVVGVPHWRLVAPRPRPVAGAEPGAPDVVSATFRRAP